MDMISHLSEKFKNTMNEFSSVPRPWELTPITSMIHSAVTENDGISENLRKGFAQSLGRYATNIKPPVGYDFMYMPDGIEEMAKGILHDDSNKNWDSGKARDVLYRDLFDLPAREPSSYLEKTGDKEYTLKQNKSSFISKTGDNAGHHSVMGGVYLNPLGEGKYSYDDPWDIVSSGEKKTPFMGKLSSTYYLRALASNFLKPARVRGVVQEGKEDPDILHPIKN